MTLTFHQSKSYFDGAIRKKSVPIILKTIASIQALASITYNAHLNVKGINFYQGHLLFERLTNDLTATIDPLAERVTALGGTVDTQAKAVIDLSKGIITPVDAQKVFKFEDYIAALIPNYTEILKHVNDSITELQKIGDVNTANHYQDLVFSVLDKHLYFLESTAW